MRILKIAVRRIVSIGKKSLAVVIPKEWVSSLKLEKSDEVVLVLRDDGSITLYPINGRVVNESLTDASREVDVFGKELREDILSDRFYMKELLSRYVFSENPYSVSSIGSSNLSILQIASREGYDDLMRTALSLIDHEIDYLSNFMKQLSERDKDMIHEIERRMDLIYYSFIKASLEELSRKIRRGIDMSVLVKYISEILLIKTLEDIVDSIDRVAWRFQENKIMSIDQIELLAKILEILREIIGCVRYACGDSEFKDYFKEILDLRSSTRRLMIISPPSAQPVLAEIENLLNNIENLVEIGIMSSAREIKKEILK